jgi:thiamine pyrophosphate-dependent acetolactate synthase large subunit-like protein
MLRRVPGYSVVADEIHNSGLRDVFGLMGEGNLDLLCDLQERYGVRYVGSRHDAGAVSMAVGYANATGGFGLATLTYGPAIANCIGALISAVRSSAQILILTSHNPVDDWKNLQRMDQEKLIAGSEATLVLVDRAEDVQYAVTRAFALIARIRKPVVLSFLTSLLREDVPVADGPPPEEPQPALPEIDERQFREFETVLGGAKRPVILIGRGAVLSGAVPALLKLAQRLNAVVTTSLLAAGAAESNERGLGICGGFASASTNKILRRADVVAAFGASLNMWTTRGGYAFPQAQLLHCDWDGTAFGRSLVSADIRLVADAKVAADRLLTSLPENRQRDAWWNVDIGDIKPEELPKTDRLHPTAVGRRLNEILPANRTVTTDGGHFFEFPIRELEIQDQRGFLFTPSFGCIGLGLSSAIGAAVARPDRVSVAVCGDGGLMMALPEFDTAVRAKLPMVVVVMNDEAYGAEIKHLEHRGWNLDYARFENPDLPAVARALGGDGIGVRTLADLDLVEATLADLKRPLLIDIHVDGSITGEWVALSRGETGD